MLTSVALAALLAVLLFLAWTLGLAETSVVTTGYGDGEVLARLGVLGPTRMDYPTTMAAVGAVSRYVSRILSS